MILLDEMLFHPEILLVKARSLFASQDEVLSSAHMPRPVVMQCKVVALPCAPTVSGGVEPEHEAFMLDPGAEPRNEATQPPLRSHTELSCERNVYGAYKKIKAVVLSALSSATKARIGRIREQSCCGDAARQALGVARG